MNFKPKGKIVINSYKTYNPNKKNTSIMSEANVILPSGNNKTNLSNNINKTDIIGNNDILKTTRDVNPTSMLKEVKLQTIETNTGSISHRINKSCNRLNLNESTSPLKKKTGSMKRVTNVVVSKSILDKQSNLISKNSNTKTIKLQNFNNKQLLEKVKEINSSKNSSRNSPSKFKYSSKFDSSEENFNYNYNTSNNKNNICNSFDKYSINNSIKEFGEFIKDFKTAKLPVTQEEDNKFNDIILTLQTTANSLKLDLLLSINSDNVNLTSAKNEKDLYFIDNINNNSERRKKVYNNLLRKMKEDIEEINKLLLIENMFNNKNEIVKEDIKDRNIFNRLLPSRKTTIEFDDSSIVDEDTNIKIPSFKAIFINKDKENNTIKKLDSNKPQIFTTYCNSNNEYEENLTTNVTFSDCNGTTENSQLLIDTDTLNNYSLKDEK